MASIRANNVVALIVIGMGLLVTLSACGNSKYAEVLSAEDLWADGQTATVPDADTQTERRARSDQTDQTGGSFEGPSIDEESLGLSESLVSATEPPSIPVSPAPDASDAEATPSSPARVLPEGYSQSPRVERSPVSDYVPGLPPQVFRDARVREFRVSAPDQPAKAIVQAEVPASTSTPTPASTPNPASVSEVAKNPLSTAKALSTEEPVVEPEMEPEIAELDPSDFISEAPEPPLGAGRVETGMESALDDVFFDFDQYAIRSSHIPVLEKNAELLREAYQASNVLIEGHCDERGTGEYNLELGKRRAQAIKGYLIDLGVEASRIEIASYGKEKPFCAESTPNCWQHNRRGHFVERVLRTSLSK